ncbi:MAG: glycosyltransferase [Verrucomicrobiales bacterium]|nr:glycosyltransferase [Verrucomicrobiales bacterium]
MKILITNSLLQGLGGAQIFVRDLGRALERMGHEVMAFSSYPGRADKLEALGMIRTTDDPTACGFQPDIIHAQHHLDAMAAILALPGVPALYHCHGAVWRECVPKHPRILHYLAMSRTLRERIVIESGIPPENISLWLNTADLSRFSTVRTPPERPSRALLYNKIHRPDSPTVLAIREAADAMGLQFDCIGQKFGNEIPHPETVLPQYDIVFASGKSAVDALACGCALIVLGRTGCGRMVLPENFDHFRSVNFSIPVNSPAPDARKIQAELANYSASACAQVSARLRSEADHQRSVELLTALYQRIIEQFRHARQDPAAEASAALAYLRKIVPLVRGTELAPADQILATTR